MAETRNLTIRTGSVDGGEWTIDVYEGKMTINGGMHRDAYGPVDIPLASAAQLVSDIHLAVKAAQAGESRLSSFNTAPELQHMLDPEKMPKDWDPAPRPYSDDGYQRDEDLVSFPSVIPIDRIPAEILEQLEALAEEMKTTGNGSYPAHNVWSKQPKWLATLRSIISDAKGAAS